MENSGGAWGVKYRSAATAVTDQEAARKADGALRRASAGNGEAIPARRRVSRERNYPNEEAPGTGLQALLISFVTRAIPMG